VRFGGGRQRGVVVDVADDPPPGIEAAEAERVVETLPPALVDLALWLADYYGSTPGRTLALVAPPGRVRKVGERAAPAVREGLEGEAEPAELSATQRAAVGRIVGAMDAGEGGPYLLYGATGSGKTEVYLQACAAALERGLGAIVLVPEIALTPQAVGRFRARFGDRIAILHSGLTEAERRDERDRILAGEARVVIGARSAVFAPVRGLGLIVVDEEHDQSYKQDSDPRYDARTVAAKRAALEGAVAVYGTATPRPESWERLERLELGGRITGALPPVQVVDLRREAGYPLSAPLLEALGRVADDGGKAILLLNRRGIAPALHCRACGVTIRCPNCDVALVLHADGRLHCHHCGHAEEGTETCPACHSPELVRIGAGTQKLERELAAQVPELERFRLDADAVAKPGAVAGVLGAFAVADRAVLVGTQMVAKGHHFAGVALAAVVDADTGLGMPDFRAEERTFQLLTQLAGRSGRDAPGRVLVQTFQPDARAIRFAARHDVSGFLGGELERRRELGYPPYRHLVRIVVAGPDPDAATRALLEVKAGLGDADVLGPAPVLRLRGKWRVQLVAKTDRPRALAARAGRLLSAAAPAMRRAGLTAVVDVDPQSL
jgi:primosomal protein N' (replication factor Y)